MATDGYYISTILDIATTVSEWVSDVINDLTKTKEQETEEGQPKEERDWRE